MRDLAYVCVKAYAYQMKPIVWVGSAKADLKELPASVLDDMGHQLFRVQCGLEPDDWKPMPSVGVGVKEIRVRDPSGAFRTIYLATRAEAVFVLHCFRKSGQKTAQRDIELARQRLNRLLRAPHG